MVKNPMRLGLITPFCAVLIFSMHTPLAAEQKNTLSPPPTAAKPQKTPANATAEPAIKMSKSGICHAKGNPFYARVKKYTAFDTMDACLKNGGRATKTP